MVLHVETITPTQRAALEVHRRLTKRIEDHYSEIVKPQTARPTNSGPPRPVDPEDVPHPPLTIKIWIERCMGERPTVRFIQRVVARHYSWGLDDILCGIRSKDVVRPRQIAMYLARKLTVLSYPELGRRFGGRDPTTILHGARKIASRMREDMVFKAEVHEVEKKIVGTK